MSHPQATLDGSIALDTVFALLKHRRRRAIIDVLDSTTSRLTLTELADELATRADDSWDVDRSEPTSADIRLSLVHVHLPKLADANVVEYDPERKTIRSGSQFEPVRTQLPTAVSDGDVYGLARSA